MKKNFVKKLATVLSLAMVATLVAPAGSASAATAPDLAARRTYVYEGNTYSYAAINTKGYTVKWSVSGEGSEFVDLSKASGTKTNLTVDTDGSVEAKLAPVTVKAKFYKDGKLAKTRTDNVNIKVSATGVAITETATAAAGETVDFNRTLTPANATSKTYWSVTDKDGKAVEATVATIDAAGNFVANKLGDYKVVASVRNAKTSKEVATDSQDIKATLKVVSAKPVAVNKVEITMNAEYAATLSDISVVNNKTKVKMPVKAIKVVGKTINADLYTNVENGVNYTVTVKDTSASFDAVVGTIKSIVVKDKTFTPGTTDIDYSILDENGLDVTAKYSDSDFSFYSTKAITSGQITLASDGDGANVYMKYIKYNTTTGADESITSNTAFYKASNNAASTTKAWTITSGTPDYDEADQVHYVSVGDTSKKLYVRFTGSNGTDITDVVTDYTSTDSSILFVDKNGVLYPYKEGTVAVKVKNGDFEDYLYVTVKAKREATSVAASTNALTLSTTVNEIGKVTLTLKDQFGNDLEAGTNTTVTVDYLSGATDTLNVPTVAAVTSTSKKTDVTFTIANTTKTGTTYYKATWAGKTTIIGVTTKAAGSHANYVVSVDDTEMDTKTEFNNKFAVYAVDSANVKRTIVTGAAISEYKVTNAKDEVKVSGAAITGEWTTISGIASALTSWADGTYTISVKLGNVWVSNTFVIKTSRTVPTVKVNTVNITDTTRTTLATVLANAWEESEGTITAVTFDTYDPTVVDAAGNVLRTNSSVRLYVKQVTVTVSGFDFVIDVNTLITLN